VTALVVCFPAAAWLDLLEAASTGASFAFMLGKGPCPPFTCPKERSAVDIRFGRYPVRDGRLYLLGWGRLRCRVDVAALSNTVEGWRLELDLRSPPEGLTVGAETPWHLGWREPWWRPRPASPPPVKGRQKPIEPGDELPFPFWPFAGLPAELAEASRAVYRPRARPAAQGGLFDAS
jgi:hypothetical protein